MKLLDYYRSRYFGVAIKRLIQTLLQESLPITSIVENHPNHYIDKTKRTKVKSLIRKAKVKDSIG
jgi:hypothetical protein